MKLKRVALFFIIALMAFPSSSYADFVLATSTTTIDWTTFSYSPGVTFEPSFTYDDVSAFGGLFSASVSPWGTVSTGIPVGTSTGFAWTSGNEIGASAGAGASDAWIPHSSGDATSTRSGYFTVLDDSTVTFSADSTIDITRIIDNGLAINYASSYLYVYNDTTGASAMDENWFSGYMFHYSSLGGYISDFYDDPLLNETLTVSLHFSPGDVGYFQAGPYAYAEAQVPEPTTILLLGLGLIGVAGTRMKFKN